MSWSAHHIDAPGWFESHYSVLALIGTEMLKRHDELRQIAQVLWRDACNMGGLLEREAYGQAAEVAYPREVEELRFNLAMKAFARSLHHRLAQARHQMPMLHADWIMAVARGLLDQFMCAYGFSKAEINRTRIKLIDLPEVDDGTLRLPSEWQLYVTAELKCQVWHYRTVVRS